MKTALAALGSALLLFTVVRADEGMNMSALNLKIHLIDCDESFEFARQVSGFKNDVRHSYS